MKWNVHNVPNPDNWKVIDVRTGFEIHESPEWFITDVDDESHVVIFQRETDGVFDMICGPRLFMDFKRCVVLMFISDDLVKQDFEFAQLRRILG